MKTRDKANQFRLEHKEWRNYNFNNKEGFFPLFSDFKNEMKYLSPGAISLFVYFGLHSNNITGECSHSLETIAQNLDKSVRTISNWIKELESNQLIERLQLDFNKSSRTFIIPYTKRYLKEKNIKK